MQTYHIIDCRFPYEFDGGHIEGAINVNTDMMVEELLLKPGGGLYSNGGDFPQPSRSGSQETGKPVVVIFHCEFSNKRAPTFAKHLRSKDRTLNNQHYPKVYYPELYILEGGYCHFYKTNSVSGGPDDCATRSNQSVHRTNVIHRDTSRWMILATPSDVTTISTTSEDHFRELDLIRLARAKRI
jgi:rhodanese-related sulfurtransferase